MQQTTEAVALNRMAKAPLEPFVEAFVATSANLGSRSEKFAEVAHDARNMVTALGCFCDLLEAPGVLTEAHQHYGNELRLVAAASRKLIDKLLTLEGASAVATNDTALNVTVRSLPEPSLKGSSTPKYQDQSAPKLIDDFAWELQMNRNMLAALAGPSIMLTVDTPSGALPVQMHCEDLTRILVNLVKNAVQAMPRGGSIRLTTSEVPTAPGDNACVLLNVEDNGPGISLSTLERIFEAGYTTRSIDTDGYGTWKPEHHGLGLAITRSLVERAGGCIHAANRNPSGTCFQIELPARNA